MDLKSRIDAMEELASTGDNERLWQEFYAEDVVRQLPESELLVGRDAARQQTVEFLNNLVSPQKVERRTLALDQENNVSIAEYDHTFHHREFGEISQRLVVVQRWRDGKIHEEGMFVLPQLAHAID